MFGTIKTTLLASGLSAVIGLAGGWRLANQAAEADRANALAAAITRYQDEVATNQIIAQKLNKEKLALETIVAKQKAEYEQLRTHKKAPTECPVDDSYVISIERLLNTN